MHENAGLGQVGQLLKRYRLTKRITLRQLCGMISIDAGNYSRVERGVFAPPSREKLNAICSILGVPDKDRAELLDRADIERGQLPADLLNDTVLLKELPLLFRAVRQNDDKALDEFIEAIRNESNHS